MHSWFNY